MSENNPKINASLIRIILCVVVIVICMLGLLDVVADKYTVPAASLVLMCNSIWNGVSYLKNGKKKMAVCVFAIAVMLLVITVVYLVQLFR